MTIKLYVHDNQPHDRQHNATYCVGAQASLTIALSKQKIRNVIHHVLTENMVFVLIIMVLIHQQFEKTCYASSLVCFFFDL